MKNPEEKDHKKEIEKIISEIECSKDFECYKSGFTKLCKVTDIGSSAFLECHDKNAKECNFSFPFGDSVICQCPMRIYISKNLKK